MTLNLTFKDDAAVLSRRERKKNNQKFNIIRAALSLFEKNGYDKTSVADIANEANVAYATFFKYFPSKLDLLNAMDETEYEDLVEVLNLRFSDNDSMHDILYGVCAEWERDALKYRRIFVRIQENTMLKNMEPHFSKVELLIKQIIEQGIEKGEFRKDTDPELITLLLSGLHCKVFQNNHPDLFDEGFDLIIDSILVK